MPPSRTSSKKRDDMYRDRRRRKVCAFCADKTVQIDYKEINRLRRYLSERAKIEPRRKTGTCAEHQRQLAVALNVILLAAELFTNGIEWFGHKLNLAEGAVGSVLAAVGRPCPRR